MAVTQARLGILRLNAGRLNFVAPTVPHSPIPPHLSYAGPLVLQWQGAGQAFDVYFGTTTSPPLIGTTTSLAFVAPPLTLGVVYYWRVVAHANALGPAQSSALWQFTATAPVVAIYIAPPNHSVNQVTTGLVLQWEHPVVSAGDTVFDVYFGPVASALPLVSRGQAAKTFNLGALAAGVDYYWRVVSRNNAASVSGPTWTFETRNPTKGLITIGGVDVRARTRIAGISIRDLLADTPNTATLTVEGSAPSVGQEVRIGLASLSGDDVIFGGYIDTVDSVYEGRPENRAWRVTAQDYVYGMNRRKVRTRYGQASATAIALDLLAAYAPSGYTGTHVAAGLPVVSGGIDFTDEDLATCFARLAQRIGGYWYVDYARDVHLFLTESADAPTTITKAARVLLDDPPIHWTTDLSQIRTRVYVEGGGSQARNVVVPGATTLPVTDGRWYSSTGGIVVSGPQRITYTGKASVAGGPAPTAVGQAIVGALGAGPYSYVTTAITDGAESPQSAASAPVTLTAVASPVSAPIITPVVGVVLDPSSPPTLTAIATVVSAPTTGVSMTGVLPTTGTVAAPGVRPHSHKLVDLGTGTMHPAGPSQSYWWACTHTNARGETTLGPDTYTSLHATQASNAEITIPAAPTGQGITGTKVYRAEVVGVMVGPFHLVASVSAVGGVFKDTVPKISLGPPAPTTNTTGTPGGGSLTPGVYRWRVKFITSSGETEGGQSAGYTVSGTYSGVQLSNVPTSGDGRVIARKIYRTKVNGGTLDQDFYFEVTINDNTTTTYLSSKSDTSLGASMANDYNSTGTGKLSRGAAYAWQVSFVTSAGETLVGPWSSLQLASNQDTVDLAQIPISTDIRVTKRKVYRTAAGGGAFRLETTINDNTTTTYRSASVADGALGANPPTTNTTGSGGLTPGLYYWTYRFVTAAGVSNGATPGERYIQAGSDTAQLSGIAVSPDARVTKRQVFRTAANGGTFKLEAEINDNTTTTYTSTKRDDQLGADLIWGNTTSASGQIAVSNIAVGPVGTTERRLYRTVSGGASFQYVATINGNAATTYQDNRADTALGGVVGGDPIIELVGIPASGTGAVRYEIRPGADVNLVVQCDDTAAQAALAALEGPPSQGIVEHTLQDRRVGLSEATAMGNADLLLFARPIITIQYATRDPKTRSGKTVRIDLPELSLVGDFTIQTVEIDEIDLHPGLHPKYRVTCSSVRFSFEDAVRRFQLET
jgi:hypothetical protein